MMFRAVVQLFRSYDVNSLYDTVTFDWRETQDEAVREDMQSLCQNNFYARGRIEMMERT